MVNGSTQGPENKRKKISGLEPDTADAAFHREVTFSCATDPCWSQPYRGTSEKSKALYPIELPLPPCRKGTGFEPAASRLSVEVAPLCATDTATCQKSGTRFWGPASGNKRKKRRSPIPLSASLPKQGQVRDSNPNPSFRRDEVAFFYATDA